MVVKKGLSVRQTEQLCKTFKAGGGEAKGGAIKDEADLQYITESLRTYLHTKVRLAGSTSRGKIEISYFSGAELERLLTMMGPPVLRLGDLYEATAPGPAGCFARPPATYRCLQPKSSCSATPSAL